MTPTHGGAAVPPTIGVSSLEVGISKAHGNFRHDGTADGCEIPTSPKGWLKTQQNNGINHRFRMVQDFAGPSTA